MEKKIDDYLPFILKSNNIARIEDNTVLIGDRRAYPLKKEFVTCHSLEDVAVAIETMVTQGGGPTRAAMVAMLLLSERSDRGEVKRDKELFINAKKRLQRTRPTNTTMARVLDIIVSEICSAIDSDKKLKDIVQSFIDMHQNEYENNSLKMAEIRTGDKPRMCHNPRR